MVKEERRTNITESEIINETPRDTLPSSNLPRGISGITRDIIRQRGEAPGGIPEEDDELDYPGNIEIKNMIIGFAPDGRQVVDVVVEFDEVLGASTYDVRVTKP